MIQALFFDAAGTLIEPAEPVADTYARLLSPHLGSLDPADLSASFGEAFRKAGEPEYRDFQDGDAAERHWWRSVVESTVGQNVSNEAFRELFDFYAKADAWRTFPEARSILSRTREIGLKCAVVSNFDRRLHRILAEAGLRFDTIVTSADARARKPSPEIFIKALRSLDLEADQALHVGDSEEADLIGARTAGVDAYLLTRPHNDLRDFLDWAMSRHRIG